MINPLYLQIAEEIKQKISKGVLKPGDAVPSESALCQEYGVSRMTVRKGLAILAKDGYIYSIPGKGSFVQKPELNKYIIYYDEMKNPINTVDYSRLLEVNIIMPDEKLARELEITRNKNVIVIRRLFYTEGNPIAYDIKYLPYFKGMPIVEKELEQATLLEMISGEMPSFSLMNELSIYASTPDEEIKKLLNIHNDLALLVIEQRLHNEENKPIGFCVTYFRGDYIKLKGRSE